MKRGMVFTGVNNGIGLDPGWMTNRDAGVDTNTFGTWLTYVYEF